MKVHHTGYLVGDTEKTKNVFIELGYTIEQGKQYDNIRDVYITFMINGLLNGKVN